uniref:Major facilitator superfamily domain-containing protein 12-like n=1 Tax=Saccoglossus kowalevskii TaxID=10224 RepID=A0ABM0M3L1_SACKO|nr:PREDICTED: major facilitator superfamily domain-containing protein 12-like [Saccoglossus kowalevskii]
MDRLPILKRYAYGVGHVQNDLCASLWFSYLLIYFHTVLSFSNSMAGNLMLLGQIVDAISTPLVGYESDKTSTRFYGKRKTWHLLGTICVAVSFPFLFNPCITCNDSPDWARFIYYAPFVAIFQFGWASTQISHLALIPELSPNESTRVELNAIRYAFTVIANIFVYGLTWFLLDLFSGSIPANDTEQSLSPDDIPTFTKLSAIVIGTGIVFSSIFHIGTKENPGRALQESTHLINGHLSEQRQMSWKSWLIEPQFYLIALLYMCTRLMVNISQVYIPLFLHDTLHLDKIYIAIIPLIIYISGFLTSLFMKLINAFIGRKLTYMFGALMVIAFSTSLWFRNIGNGIYASAVLIGAGGSTVLPD